MNTIEIKGFLRTDLGKKSSRRLRKEGNVPCVIYGREQNVHFHAHENSFIKLVFTPDAHLVKLDIEGKEYHVVLKDLQFHPVSDKIAHADFIQVLDNKPIVINLPIRVTGESVGVKAGGKLRIKRRHLRIKGFVNDIPEFLPVDITDVKIHHSIKVGDLAFEKLELLDPKITTVLSIATSRVVQKTEEEEAAEKAAAEAAAATEAPAVEEKGK